MKIVVDINHPKDVNFFKNFIWEMKKRGHEILITATEKDVSFQLLKTYEFDYINLGSYGKSLFQKVINMPMIDLKMYKSVKSFNPDIFLGFGSIRAAHTSYLLHKKCILFEDTEHSTEQIFLYLPFVNAVYTPKCFKKDLGNKQIRFDGYSELAYLHQSYFTPNPDVLDELGIGESEYFIILRFVPWNASHDAGHTGLTLEDKRKAVAEFRKYGRVFITSENPLPKEFENYRISISQKKMHDLLYYATLLYGESATMASECAVLGTHAIFCDYAGRGYTDEEEMKYGLVYNFHNEDSMGKDSLDKALELLRNPSLFKEGKIKRTKLLNDKVNLTKFMVELIEGY